MEIKVREFGKDNYYFRGEADTVHCGENTHIDWIGKNTENGIVITTDKVYKTEYDKDTLYLGYGEC